MGQEKEKEKKGLRAVLSSLCWFDCEVKEDSGGLFGRLTLKPQWTHLSLTSPRLEVNTENDLFSPAQLKTKRNCGRGH